MAKPEPHVADVSTMDESVMVQRNEEILKSDEKGHDKDVRVFKAPISPKRPIGEVIAEAKAKKQAGAKLYPGPKWTNTEKQKKSLNEYRMLSREYGKDRDGFYKFLAVECVKRDQTTEQLIEIVMDKKAEVKELKRKLKEVNRMSTRVSVNRKGADSSDAVKKARFEKAIREIEES